MKKTVLIADDEPNIVVSLEYLLEHSGYNVKIARDGVEALTCVEAFHPDLILLDVMLPRKNGFEVCQKIRESEDAQRTRIIMLTAKGREIEVSKGFALGADAYITKPFSTKDLMSEVRRLLGDVESASG
jgi:DNA-binding response OmpR family regulator